MAACDKHLRCSFWHSCTDAPFQATAATPLYIKNATVLPVNIPDDPVANIGVGAPTTGQSKATTATRPIPAKTLSAPSTGAATGTLDTPKKPPVAFKPKPPVMGVKKPVVKKM
ncbi:hypothetical protein ETH_00021030 [Eimeria tenella]|uniref:Uncharacterized protein n=1 Tax=Eimeria tenella TaxID=5802 RepID=U6KV88_EIMTE|nr:hypothetical protein ETH_00021030 [Eimeria tenella]CDJ40279.1 hypothetical protein ETH_00021030 [Eimeria tenella]|eukprot:XP_013231032.1 hypothetical protein ETH_00021030 [Eimeria tenella]